MADNYLERQYEKLIGSRSYTDPETGYSVKKKTKKKQSPKALQQDD